MKPYSILACLSLFSMSLLQVSFSQTVNQGVWIAGGSAAFLSSKQEGAGDPTTNIAFAPNAGYFVINDLGAGLNVVFSRTGQNNSSLMAFSFGPWARYYVIENAFVQAGFQLGTSRLKGVFGEAKTTSTQFDAGAGYSAWLTKSVALEPMLLFNILSLKDEGIDPLNTTSFGLRVGFQVFIGRE